MTDSLERLTELAKKRIEEAEDKEIGSKLVYITRELGKFTEEKSKSGENITDQNGSYSDEDIKISYLYDNYYWYSRHHAEESLKMKSTIEFKGKIVFENHIYYSEATASPTHGSKNTIIDKYIPGSWETIFDGLYAKAVKTREAKDAKQRDIEAKQRLKETNRKAQELKENFGL